MTKRTNNSETENVDQNQSKAARAAKALDGVTIAFAKPIVLAEQGDETWIVKDEDLKARADLPADAFARMALPRARRRPNSKIARPARAESPQGQRRHLQQEHRRRGRHRHRRRREVHAHQEGPDHKPLARVHEAARDRKRGEEHGAQDADQGGHHEGGAPPRTTEADPPPADSPRPPSGAHWQFLEQYPDLLSETHKVAKQLMFEKDTEARYIKAPTKDAVGNPTTGFTGFSKPTEEVAAEVAVA